MFVYDSVRWRSSQKMDISKSIRFFQFFLIYKVRKNVYIFKIHFGAFFFLLFEFLKSNAIYLCQVISISLFSRVFKKFWNTSFWTLEIWTELFIFEQ